MIHAYKFKTATQLHTKLTDRLTFASADQIDMYSSVDVHMLNVIARAESFEWDFDLKDLWLTKARWHMLARQYVNPHALDAWLDLIEDRMSKKNGRGMALMRTNQVKPRLKQKKASRRWGSCMLAVSFRRVPEPQITLYSRTSYLGYLSPLDITVAHACAQLVSERLGIAVEEMSFVWMAEDMQYSFKSLAWLFNNEEWRDRMEQCDTSDLSERAKAPGLFLSTKWYEVFKKEDEDGVLYGDMTWGACRRIRRRWHTEVFGPEYGKQFEGGRVGGSQNKVYPILPSVHSSTLDLSCLDRIRRDTDPEDAEGFVESEPPTDMEMD